MGSTNAKQVKIGHRPSKKAAGADAWVERREEPEKLKRLTLDVPLSLHRRIKTSCATRDTSMADELRALLQREYGSK